MKRSLAIVCISAAVLSGWLFAAVSRTEPVEANRSKENTRLARHRVDRAQEVNNFQSEVKKKEKLIVSLLSQVAAAQKQSDTSAEISTVQEQPLEMDAYLDDRILSADPDSNRAVEDRTEIQSAIDSGLLISTTVRFLRCGDNLCKLVLANKDNAEMEGETVALVEQVGKRFGAVASSRAKNNEKVLYFAKQASDFENYAPQ
jgi:vacuolar-type H+-ATPase subunit I/STV1